MNKIKIESDVKIGECPDCKIWNDRYNIKGELCPRCLGLSTRLAMQAFTKAYLDTV